MVKLFSRFSLLLCLGAVLTLNSCTLELIGSSASSENDSPDSTPLLLSGGPLSLSYSHQNVTYPVNASIPNNVPTVVGLAAEEFSISPALPPSLNFDTLTGVISGTAPATPVDPATPYTITASNSEGSTSTQISIRVIQGFVVDSLLDDANGAADGVCDAPSTGCTLREAILEAEDRLGEDVILLPEGTIPLGAEFTINESLTLTGASKALSILDSNQDGTGIFKIAGPASSEPFSFSNLQFIRGQAGGLGGAINIANGDVTLEDIRFVGNTAGVAGGAIYVSPGCIVRMERNYFENNSAPHGGAADNDGTIIANNSIFIGNRAAAAGFGGALVDGYYTVTNSIFYQNLAGTRAVPGAGGAVSGACCNHSFTFEGNIFAENAAGQGGAIAISGGTMDTAATLNNNTFINNESYTDGAALYTSGLNPIELNSNLFQGNRANTNTTSVENDCFITGAGTVTSLGSNLTNIGPGNACDIGNGANDQISSDAQLSQTATGQDIMLRNSSPAIDAGDDASCPTEDLRGKSRVQVSSAPFGGTATCDIGAIEKQDGNPPESISYGRSWAAVLRNRSFPINNFTPTVVAGEISGFSVDPPLSSAGLEFNTETGMISGTPTSVFPATKFTITAHNPYGSVSTHLTIQVSDGFYVNSSSDIPDDDSATAPDGECDAVAATLLPGESGTPCTLRAAVYEADNFGDTPVVIQIASGTILYNAAQVTAMVAPSTVNDLTVIGSGAANTILNGAASTTVPFARNSGTTRILRFADMGIRVFSISAMGAAITNTSSAQVHVSNVTFRNNLSSHAFGGGAIYSSAGILNVEHSSFINNQSTAGPGGAIRAGDGVIVDLNSNLYEANAATNGGAIALGATNVLPGKIRNSVFNSNSSASGVGGLVSGYNNLFVTNNLFYRNDGSTTGGLGVSGGTVRTYLFNNTLIENTVNSAGNPGAFQTLAGTTPFFIANNIIANNTNTIDTVINNCPVDGTITSLGNNLEDNGECNLIHANDLGGSNLLTEINLGNYTNNGGSYWSVLPAASSIAIDAANPSYCTSSVDQKGQTRVKDGNGDGTYVCDIGAAER